MNKKEHILAFTLTLLEELRNSDVPLPVASRQKVAAFLSSLSPGAAVTAGTLPTRTSALPEARAAATARTSSASATASKSRSSTPTSSLTQEVAKSLRHSSQNKTASPLSTPPSMPTTTSIPATPTRSTLSLDEKITKLAALSSRVATCQNCPDLVQSRTTVVFGSGNPEASLVLIGEAPSEEEDASGLPGKGPAAQLLDKILETMGLQRHDVYLINIIKCRPPALTAGSARKPTPEEIKNCLPYLQEQISILQPKVIISLGSTALKALTGTQKPIASLRGQWQTFQDIPLMPTYHPSFLLRSKELSDKRKVWEDMLQVMAALKIPISQRQQQFFLSSKT